MRIDFVGLENIGGHCAHHILASGHQLIVTDLDSSARKRLVEAAQRRQLTPQKSRRQARQS